MAENRPTNPHHRADTFSTTLIQKFEDGDGLPLDDPIVQDRERNRKAQPNQNDSASGNEPTS